MSAEKGRPSGSRDRLTSAFIDNLADDFEGAACQDFSINLPMSPSRTALRR